MKKLIKLFVIAAIVVVGLGIVKNGIAQVILTSALSKAVHVPVKIKSVNLSFLSASINLKGMNVHNPSGFNDKLLAEIPHIFIDFEPGELLKGRAHFKEVRLDLKEMTVIKNKDGKMNVDSVKPSPTEKRTAKEKAKPETGDKPPKLMIDKLSLSIGRVVYKDYSAGGDPVVQVFDINIKDREYTNIDDPAAIVSLLMFEALTRTTLASLASLDVNAFKEGGIQALSKGLGVVGDGTDIIQNKAKELLNLLN